MTELININFESQFPVNGRDLHMKLEVATVYPNWIKRMIDYGFTENIDYEVIQTAPASLSKNGKAPNQPLPTLRTDHQLTMDMAKHICMVQRSEKGKEIRQYFIDVEKCWNSPEAIMQRALKIAHKRNEELKMQIAKLLPKVRVYETCIDHKDAIIWRDMANEIRDTLGVSEKDMRDELVKRRWIYKVNEYNGKSKYKPYKETIDRGLMIVKPILCKDGKVRECNYFTNKGREALIDIFAPKVAVE